MYWIATRIGFWKPPEAGLELTNNRWETFEAFAACQIYLFQKMKQAQAIWKSSQGLVIFDVEFILRLLDVRASAWTRTNRAQWVHKGITGAIGNSNTLYYGFGFVIDLPIF